VVPQVLTALASSSDGAQLLVLREQLSDLIAPSVLFSEAVPFVIPFLLRIAQAPDRPAAASASRILLTELAYGEAHQSEIDAGNINLDQEVKRQLAFGRDFFYDTYRDSAEPGVRALAVEFLAAVDARSPQFTELLQGIDRQRDHSLVVDAVAEAERYSGAGRGARCRRRGNG
jgi:hypothetical protein